MTRINVLARHIADLIAAGEVVERPASAVKELVENAVDAGASTITVEIKRGGLRQIRVTDDGHGIAPEDVKTAFMRHATSKIRDERDLGAIATLGFRGEALSSIAAVAKVDLYTAVEGRTGRLIEIAGGEVLDFREAGCPVGTTIVVNDLFYNTPARMKFLKKDTTEGQYVLGVLQRAALAAPETAFKFLRDGELVFHTPGDGELFTAVRAVFGREFSTTLLPVSGRHEGIEVRGFVSRPTGAQGSRAKQLFFVGGRPVRSAMLKSALEEPYKNRLMTGRFPAAVLLIDVPPELVDVNVHPAKTEVKFAFDRHVFDAVYMAVRSALEKETGREPIASARRPPAPETPMAERPKQFSFDQIAILTGQAAPLVERMAERQREAAPQAKPAGYPFSAPEKRKENPDAPFEPGFQPPMITAEQVQATYLDGKGRPAAVIRPIVPKDEEVRQPVAPYAASYRHLPVDETPAAPPQTWVIRGELFASYIVVEDGDDVLLVDKHAAHERIVFERLKKAGSTPMVQMLIEPRVYTPGAVEFVLLTEAAAFLRSVGYEFSELGRGSLMIRGVPEGLDAEDAEATLDEIAENLRQNRRFPGPAKEDDVLHLVACKAALKAKSATSPEEMRALITQVMTLPDIKYCPHGRPVALCLTKGELEKHFGRA
ncbi:DNA mismatch repair endonuclease MutL [Oscillospiraceae bacterium OttesenSCG-928-F05]|nr:DNA mismatch repair endonuclease MutL [Oscillospiraceae bacterium OttesenSCG-928-F05]